MSRPPSNERTFAPLPSGKPNLRREPVGGEPTKDIRPRYAGVHRPVEDRPVVSEPVPVRVVRPTGSKTRVYLAALWARVCGWLA